MEDNEKGNGWIRLGIIFFIILCGVGVGSGLESWSVYLDNGYKQLGVKYWEEEEMNCSLIFCESCIVGEDDDSNVHKVECVYKGNEVYVDRQLVGEFVNSDTFVETNGYCTYVTF